MVGNALKMGGGGKSVVAKARGWVKDYGQLGGKKKNKSRKILIIKTFTFA